MLAWKLKLLVESWNEGSLRLVIDDLLDKGKIT